jgi:hypothetical protein
LNCFPSNAAASTSTWPVLMGLTNPRHNRAPESLFLEGGS